MTAARVILALMGLVALAVGCAPTAPTAETDRVTYTCGGGETLEMVAQRVYGNDAYWQCIAESNPDVDGSDLQPGQVLFIPAPVPPQKPVAVAPARDMDEYTIMPGDRGFWGIAEKVYGDGAYCALIRKANPGVDAASLQPGETLRIPPLPERSEPTIDDGVE